MGFHRQVDIRTHGDEKFCALPPPPPNPRYLWLYLLTGPHTTPVPGLSAIGRASLAEKLEWDLADFDRVFNQLAALGMVKADWKAGVVWLPNAIRYNEPGNPKQVAGWRRWLDSVPECELKREALATLYRYLVNREAGRDPKKTQLSFREPFEKWFGESALRAYLERYPERFPIPYAIQEKDQDQDQEQDRSASRSSRVARDAGAGEGGTPAAPVSASEGAPPRATATIATPAGSGEGASESGAPAGSQAPGGATPAPALALTPEALVGLWAQTTGDQAKRPTGKFRKALARALRDRPAVADWLPAFERAVEVRRRRGDDAVWLTLRWLVEHDDGADRLLRGEFDRTFGEGRARPGVPAHLDAPAGERAGVDRREDGAARRQALREDLAAVHALNRWLRRVPERGRILGTWREAAATAAPGDRRRVFRELVTDAAWKLADGLPLDEGPSPWTRAMHRLRGSTPTYALENWFAQVRELGLDGDRLTLGVPTLFVRDWLVEHYGDAIRRTVEAIVGHPLEVAFELDVGADERDRHRPAVRAEPRPAAAC